ncbi:hypothetical protein COPCOM_01036 [Coprococcus comes ATCC 27758]|uniref:Phosphoribosyltransferase domain-containing protein n=1 Tax=Coprococcus comes ATCC 27758 TaxID=470146 RepID=C0B7B5_9FIRM|nr:hypothetical protein COPCOM_01036 [Coprococcus comes ATCC 27758]
MAGFFGDGVYMGAGGIFYSMNPKQDDAPVINTERVVIVDSVINTGKSIMRIIDELKNHNPGIDVIIAANVIQNEAVELFKDYLVFATRLSKNSFVGVNQSKQTGKTGPDTADRLFNLIKNDIEMILLQQDFFVFSQMSTFNNLLKMHKL